MVQDADLEYDPAELPLAARPIRGGQADAVFGLALPRRTAPGALLLAFGRQPLSHPASNMFTDLNLTDMETCYKMVRTPLMQHCC